MASRGVTDAQTSMLIYYGEMEKALDIFWAGEKVWRVFFFFFFFFPLSLLSLELFIYLFLVVGG